MRISAVGLTSDSSDNEDVDRNSVNGSEYTCAKSLASQNFFNENKQFDAEQRIPLFKVIFKDKSTSRKYRKSLEDIMNYLVSTKLGEDIESDADQGLVLEIYEPNEKCNTKTSGTTRESSEPHVIDHNHNRNVTFNIEKAINMVSMSKNGVNFQNNHILTSTQSLNQTIQSVRYFGVSNYEIQQYSQPQEVQLPIFQQQLSMSENLNIKKRKWVDDSDFTVLRKKQRVDYASEHLSNFHNTFDMLKNAEINQVDQPYYDPVWYKTNNRQTVATENMKNADTKAPISYDSAWYNSSIKPATATESDSLEETVNSSQAQVTSTESTTLKETKDSCRQAQATSSLKINEKSITTFTYRVLKVGTLDYTTKRTFSISKDGIQFCAHHLSEVSTIVKVNIEIVNIVTIEASFSQILPALFVYINDKAAINVREALGFNNDSNAYLDPWSTDENCNKIIILPDQMSENCRVTKNLIKLGVINKLDKKSADYILRNSFSKTLGRQNLENNHLVNRDTVNITAQIVRIGTYKCSKMRFNVMISAEGFQFQIPKIGDDEIYRKITVYFDEIEKLYFSISKVSAFFLHVNCNCAQRIRSVIEMSVTDKKKVYFDPNSENIAEQRLVIIFNKIKPHQQETLKILLSYTQSAEISLNKIIHQMLFNHM